MVRGQFVRRALRFFAGPQPISTRLRRVQQGTQRFNLRGLEQPAEGRQPVQSREHGFDLASDG